MTWRGALLALLLAGPVVAQPEPLGVEFQVNTYTTSYQYRPAVAAGDDGAFVVVWDGGADGYGFGVFAQQFDAAGEALSVEFQVNTYTTYQQYRADVSVAASGAFVVTWDSQLQDGEPLGAVFAQRYDAAGVAQATEFQVNTYTESGQIGPGIASEPDGDFVVVWQSEGQDGSLNGIFAQRFNASGVAQATEFQVNTHTASAQGDPDVAASATGFVVAWDSYAQDGDGAGIFAQRFDAAGVAQATEFQVNTYTTEAQRRAAVGMSSDGSFVVAWQSTGQDGDAFGIFARRFSAAGVAQAIEFQVNTITSYSNSKPAISVEGAGAFVIAWESSQNQDGDSAAIFAQRYDADGAAVASEFQVNTYTEGNQYTPSIAANGGVFVVAWESYAQDGDSYGIFAQLYEGEEEPTATPTATPAANPTATPRPPSHSHWSRQLGRPQ